MSDITNPNIPTILPPRVPTLTTTVNIPTPNPPTILPPLNQIDDDDDDSTISFECDEYESTTITDDMELPTIEETDEEEEEE